MFSGNETFCLQQVDFYSFPKLLFYDFTFCSFEIDLHQFLYTCCSLR